MKSVIKTIYEHAGKPPVKNQMTTSEYQVAKKSVAKPSYPPSGVCYLSGIAIEDVAVPVKKRIGSTWTSHGDAAAPHSEWLSPQAVFSLEEKAKRTDDEKPFAMRSYSHYVTNGQWTPFGLKEKQFAIDKLLAPPLDDWAMTLTSSPMAASHQLYKAPINPVKSYEWQVLLDGDLIVSTPDEFDTLLTPFVHLMEWHSKSAIATGRYHVIAISKQGEQDWLHYDKTIKQYRNTPLLALVEFLAQKPENKKDE